MSCQRGAGGTLLFKRERLVPGPRLNGRTRITGKRYVTRGKSREVEGREVPVRV